MREGWKARSGWETKNIRSDAKVRVFLYLFLALVFDASSVFIVFITLPDALEKGEYVALLLLVFPLVGTYLVYKAVLLLFEYWRFGAVLFEMDPFPGAIGGQVGGRVHVSRLPYNVAVDSLAQLSVRLECVYTFLVGITAAAGPSSVRGRKRIEQIKWTEEGQPLCKMAKQGVSLAFRFDVPDRLPTADVVQIEAYHFWRLTVKADIRGVDLHRRFNVPVFQTGEASRHVDHDISTQVASRKDRHSEALKDAISQGDLDLPGLPSVIRVSEDGDETRLFFPMFRNKMLAGFIGVLTGVFVFFSVSRVGPALMRGDIFLPLIVLPFFLGAILFSTFAIYLLFNTLGVYIRPGHLMIVRRVLFVRVFFRQLGATDLSHLSIKWSGSRGQGEDAITNFIVLAHDQAGKSVTIAEGVEGHDLAANFCDYLAQRLHVESRAL